MGYEEKMESERREAEQSIITTAKKLSRANNAARLENSRFFTRH